ncbi:MAG: hypothetical protein DRJ36_01035 [Thermoprotei archaeon]|nr:MAG: hypothetical protein DRJ36_01035 [Thermoprotei archaeon]
MLYFDSKRKFIVEVEPGSTLHTDMGVVELGELIGKDYGCRLKTHLGIEFVVVRPALWQVVYLGFKRKTQVLYPKDVGYMLLMSSISPGSRVVEAGVGSGFLTAFLASIVRPNGKVYAYDISPTYIKLATTNLKKANLIGYVCLKQKDITQGIDERDIDAVVLDMPTPWLVTEHAFNSLRNGGIFIAFVPTVNQLERTVLVLREKGFIEIEAVENIQRTYKVKKGETRPRNIVIAHTGYIIVAQKP